MKTQLNMLYLTRTLAQNQRLLRSSVSKKSVAGILIAVLASVVATFLNSYLQYHSLSTEAFVLSQKQNPVLWILDALPFFFSYWGQYVSQYATSQASDLILQQSEDLRKQNELLEKQRLHDVTHDALTELPNRFLFLDRLQQSVQRNEDDQSVVVVILDLVGFHDVNDAFGHYVGDTILHRVSTSLRAAIQPPHTVARLGGDEFGLILVNQPQPKDSLAVLHALAKIFEHPFTIDDSKIDISANMGAAFFPKHGSSVDDLIRVTEIALFHAKDSKKFLVEFTEELRGDSTQRLILTHELKKALESHGMQLYYQPKIDAVSGRVVGAEALVRWKHPVFGLIYPDDFILLAERNNYMKALTTFVMTQAAEDLASWTEAGLDLTVSVNISASSLLDVELPELIRGLLAKHPAIKNSSYILEITETSVLTDPDLAITLLRAISELGVRFSIDDFGTGYSSLAYLQKMPVQELKIDKSFVLEMLQNDGSRMIVRAVIDLAHNLGLKVVAEGVEDFEIVRALREMHCDTLQGYCFSRPVPEEEFRCWLQSFDFAELEQFLIA